MGKGDSPRNCFSDKFYSNYDDINWNASESRVYISKDVALVSSLSADHEYMERQSVAKLDDNQQQELMQHVKKAFDK